jgi:hypothetical protein
METLSTIKNYRATFALYGTYFFLFPSDVGSNANKEQMIVFPEKTWKNNELGETVKHERKIWHNDFWGFEFGKGVLEER